MLVRSAALRIALVVALPFATFPTLARAEARFEPTAELPDPEELDEAKARQVFEAAFVAYQIQEYDVALEIGVVALEALIRLVGWNDQATQAAAVVVIDSLRKLGRESEADALFNEARSHMGMNVEPTPDGVQKIMESMQAFSEGRMDAAYELAREGVAMLDRDDPDYRDLPTYRAVLATLHIERQEFAQAEQLLRKNLEQAQATTDPQPIAAAMNGLAQLDYSRGAYARAEAGYRAALAEATKAGASVDEAQSAHAGLGSVAFELGQMDEAIREYELRLEIAERDFGGDERLIGALGDLGEVYENVGRFTDARPLLEREDAIVAKTYGEESTVRANAMSRLGRLYRSMAEYELAIDLWKRLLVIQETKLPPASPSIGATLNHYAETLWASDGDPAQIISMATRAADLNERHLIERVSYGSEAQKRAALESFVSGTDRVISYNVHYAANDEGATRLGVNTVLRRKGRVLDAVSGAQQALRGRLDEETRQQFDRLRERRGQIATLMMRGPSEGESVEDYRAKIAAAQSEAAQLELTLGDRNAVPEDLAPVELARVQAEIPEKTALVEFAVYRRFDARYKSFAQAFGEAHYVAYVVPREGSVTMVPLGPAAPIDEAVAALRTALADPAVSNVLTVAQRVDQLTTAKVRPLLDDVDHVLVSPDGALNLVPFAALADERGHYLVRDYQFTYLSSGRDLLRLARERPASSGAWVVGNPDFSSAQPTTGSTTGRRSIDMSAISFPPLPGTAQEVAAIGKVIEDAHVLVGDAASESALRRAERPAVLHIATHGFFLTDEMMGLAGGRGAKYVKSDEDFTPPPGAENPLVRSGLALRGANLRADGDDDGILTALEVSSLDLWGTKLVVLSACETGVGEVHNGEGVYGLRRALVMAGSESQVISLWKVDDEATRDLMVAYYKKLERGRGRSGALREAQLELARHRETAHPFYWASFIPSGSWDGVDLTSKSAEQPGPEPDRPEPGGRSGSGEWGPEIRDYWRTKHLSDKNFWVRGAYAAPIGDHDYDGASVESETAFDLALDFLLHPRLLFGIEYSRDRWFGDAASDLDLRLNRIEIDLAVDLLALPYWWRVRPALLPHAGIGTAIGRQRVNTTTIDPITMMPIAGPRSNDLLGGLGADWGADVVLYFKLGRRLSLALRGGVTRPTYWLRAGGDRLAYDKDFPRSFRWHAGVGIGPAYTH